MSRMAVIQLQEWHKGKRDLPINAGAIDQVIEIYEMKIKSRKLPDSYDLVQAEKRFISYLRRLKDMGQENQAVIDIAELQEEERGYY